MNEFGGNWTETKIEILIEYAKAYLVIMNNYAERFKWGLLYFDGFAGSGQILGDNDNAIIGAARRILEIENPRSFDLYYFVEKEKEFADILKTNTVDFYPNKKIYVVNEDCNTKIESLSLFFKNKREKFQIFGIYRSLWNATKLEFIENSTKTFCRCLDISSNWNGG